jgi:hypothetical protein
MRRRRLRTHCTAYLEVLCPELKSHGVPSRQGLEGLMGQKTQGVPAYSKLPGRLALGEAGFVVPT